jgi:hypothetical protein
MLLFHLKLQVNVTDVSRIFPSPGGKGQGRGVFNGFDPLPEIPAQF